MADIRITIEASTASGHRKGWWKRITSVDPTKKGGYSLNGEFLRAGENDLPLGAIVVEQYPTGSVKNGTNKGVAYRVEATGLVQFATCDDWYRQFLSFRDAIMAALPSAGPTPDDLATQGRRIRGVALRAERAQLVKRLAEIDRQLQADAEAQPSGGADGSHPDHSE